MTVLETIKRSAEFLAKKGVESPRLQAELLLAHLLGLKRMQLYLEFERVLTDKEVEAAREAIRRRSTREPLQHILGSTSFCGYEIAVSPSVLIPRPETEMLAESGWTFLNELVRTGRKEVRALDFGTGSGCLAIALASKCPEVQVMALDISEAALDLARRNAQGNHVAVRIQFLQSDGLNGCDGAPAFDLVISNPPYIPTEEISSLAPEVRSYDPLAALDGGEDGLRYYRLLAQEAPQLLAAGGKIMLELGDGQSESVCNIFAGQNWIVETIRADYNSRPRILVAHRA